MLFQLSLCMFFVCCVFHTFFMIPLFLLLNVICLLLFSLMYCILIFLLSLSPFVLSSPSDTTVSYSLVTMVLFQW